MTQTSKIKEILKVEERQGKYWPMFSFNLHMENWEYIKLNKKKNDAFKVWDSVTYNTIEPGKKWEEVKENNYKKSDSKQNQEWYFTSIAFQIWFQNFNPLDNKEDFKTRVLASRRIFAEMLDNYNNPDTKADTKELQNPDELPF